MWKMPIEETLFIMHSSNYCDGYFRYNAARLGISFNFKNHLLYLHRNNNHDQSFGFAHSIKYDSSVTYIGELYTNFE